MLTMRELAQIWIAFEQSRASRGLKLAAKLVILLGCRSGEALGAQWSEFNMEEQIWTVPAARAKCGAPIRRPIPTRGDDVVARNGSEISAKGRPCMSLASESEKVIEQCTLIQLAGRVRDKLDLPYWRMHDMRRTLSTRPSEERVMPGIQIISATLMDEWREVQLLIGGTLLLAKSKSRYHHELSAVDRGQRYQLSVLRAQGMSILATARAIGVHRSTPLPGAAS